MANEQAVARCVSLLCEAFGRKPTPATFEVYQIALSDVDDVALLRAATTAARTCKFMPVPADLRQMAGVASEADRALLAWSAVERSLWLGPYRHVDFDDGAINAAIRNLGGWPAFLGRFTDAEAEKWARKEFLDAYSGLSRCAVGEEECAALSGMAEASVEGGKIVPPIVHRIEAKTGRSDPPRIATAGKSATGGYVRGGEVKLIGQAGM